MLLTDSEYQNFKVHFHCTALPDEEYCVPIQVKSLNGGATWTAYISGASFHSGVDWITLYRRAAIAQFDNAARSVSLLNADNAPAHDTVIPMD